MKTTTSRKGNFTRFGLAMAVILLVSACAVTDKPALDLPPLTLASPPTSVYQGNCENTELLESWLQTADFQKRDFIRLMNEGIGKTTEELYFDVEQMARLRDRVSALVVPDCAAEAHMLLLNVMGDVLGSYQTAANGEGIDLEIVIEEHTPRFQVFDGMLAELLQRLNG